MFLQVSLSTFKIFLLAEKATEIWLTLNETSRSSPGVKTGIARRDDPEGRVEGSDGS